MDEQLKPCPWCKLAPKVHEWPDFPAAVSVECMNPGCPSGGAYVYVEAPTIAESRAGAARAWNTRPVEDAIRAEVERYQARIGELSRRLIAADNAIDSLRAENARLREALEFYADENYYSHDVCRRARAALAGEGE